MRNSFPLNQRTVSRVTNDHKYSFTLTHRILTYCNNCVAQWLTKTKMTEIITKIIHESRLSFIPIRSKVKKCKSRITKISNKYLKVACSRLRDSRVRVPYTCASCLLSEILEQVKSKSHNHSLQDMRVKWKTKQNLPNKFPTVSMKEAASNWISSFSFSLVNESLVQIVELWRLRSMSLILHIKNRSRFTSLKRLDYDTDTNDTV